MLKIEAASLGMSIDTRDAQRGRRTVNPLAGFELAARLYLGYPSGVPQGVTVGGLR